jgi:Tfp pilus assembly protein PilF
VHTNYSLLCTFYVIDNLHDSKHTWFCYVSLVYNSFEKGGKFDLAQDLCQKCLKYNKSCAKAWEMMGAIMEREQSYKDAADHYEKAWKHENQASAQVT